MSEGEYKELMLACAPLHCKENMSSVNHEYFLHHTLDVYSKTLDYMGCFLIGNKCPVNQEISSITGLPVIGCCSHKFNLAVERWISFQPHIPEASRILHDLSSEIRTVKSSEKLRDLTRLGPILSHETRWTGRFCMVRRFF